MSSVNDVLDEDIEKEFSVLRIRSRFGVELNGEEGFIVFIVLDIFVRVVVGIGE